MKVAIAGYGLEGEANYRYWRGMGADVTIADESETPHKPLPQGAKTILGAGAFERLQDFDVVVRTASLNPKKIKTNGKIWSGTREFFSRCPAPIIGVTGTKGKGTVSSFIFEILKAAGKQVHLIGNIGTVAIEEAANIQANDIVVFELSSFQLWDLKASPHVAVVLMIEPDHLDVHDSLDDYLQAKGNITRWQRGSDIAIYHPQNENSTRIGKVSPGTQLPYTEAPGAHIQDGYFYMNEQKFCSTSTVVIPGKHNLENACAAITAAWQYTRDGEAIAKGISNFKGLPHRLELVREIDGVKFYDDSFSSATASAVVAAQAFEHPVLILGGYDRGVDFAPMVGEIIKTQPKKVLLIGQTGPKLAELFKQQGAENIVEELGSPSMDEIVHKAKDAAAAGYEVVFSPGCPSFDMFKDFKERGEQFQEAVNKL